MLDDRDLPTISDKAVEGALSVLDRWCLERMVSHSLGYFGFDWVALHLNHIAGGAMTRDTARAVCRSLTDRGLARYERGLFTEEGELAGAGYRITEKGREHLRSLARED